MNKKKLLTFATATSLILSTAPTLYSKDFALPVLPQKSSPTFDMSRSDQSPISYYDLVHQSIAPKMQSISDKATFNNEKVLKEGGGVSVRLSENNYNVHINFPNQATGGRSYGWTSGEIGDWSDAMYLDNLISALSSKDSNDIKRFYELVVTTLGSSQINSPNLSIEHLKRPTQRVLSNFLAIYTAEQYRSIVPQPHFNWDDALLQTTLLGSFHAGQTTLTKYYLGTFTNKSRKQNSGVYDNFNRAPGPTAHLSPVKAAEMRDYWQFSSNPESKQSGINITRFDFELMGKSITSYESDKGNSNLKKIQQIVGGDSRNVIKSISKHFSRGQSKTSQTSELATLVGQFMIDVYQDANAITNWLQNSSAQLVQVAAPQEAVVPQAEAEAPQVVEAEETENTEESVTQEETEVVPAPAQNMSTPKDGDSWSPSDKDNVPNGFKFKCTQKKGSFLGLGGKCLAGVLKLKNKKKDKNDD